MEILAFEHTALLQKFLGRLSNILVRKIIILITHYDGHTIKKTNLMGVL